ncbi:pyruvate dehydrogenase E2 component (dihydrolipoamide acetyltransferase) [Melghirimyces profundicolus]|uniref:Dihydrolipoamide acetyltransferase component of pyruvate dehydrogenase complex n=1 Tax=Melghirimyces profundicolus TaxID=1242148 RepID=A0A2T6C0T6_9BACL|nr:dihydrolipoamide acetyltransferase family protein [Melghirimyces profundicolus]PTX61847.1 pyruvate dehydrogenase E2 component (dihydrolipoamide acetyltransferase) [Melghirimyces profundicolus]
MEVKVPKTTDEGLDSVVVFWHKREGDPIEAGEVLLEIQTEKTEFEVESPASGRVSRILKDRGDVVSVGEVVALIEDVSDASESTGDAVQEVGATVETPAPKPFVAASPRVRKLAKELGVDLTDIKGTGPGGRPTEEDVRKAVQADRSETVRFTGIRRTIANRMMKSLRESAQLTETAWADITSLQQIRKSEPEISLNTWVLLAVADALKHHPDMNATWTGDGVVQHGQVHLGVAVDTGEGLWVPVVREADARSPKELQEEVDRLSHNAREGRLSQEEMMGGTFTVSNLGGYGIQFFTPILNPPESGILGVGKAEPKLELHDGEVVERLRLPLSLTFDHRVVDGAPAARFLQHVIGLLGDPESLKPLS